MFIIKGRIIWPSSSFDSFAAPFQRLSQLSLSAFSANLLFQPNIEIKPQNLDLFDNSISSTLLQNSAASWTWIGQFGARQHSVQRGDGGFCNR